MWVALLSARQGPVIQGTRIEPRSGQRRSCYHTVFRWVQRFTPLLIEAAHPRGPFESYKAGIAMCMLPKEYGG